MAASSNDVAVFENSATNASQSSNPDKIPFYNPETDHYHFNVSCVYYAPWCMEKETEDGIKVVGFFPELLETLAQSLNFTYDYYSNERLDFGLLLENDSYTGESGAIQRHERDMLAAWVVSYKRDIRIAGSAIVHVSPCKIFHSVGPLDDSNFIGFLTTFDLEIWYFLVLALFAIISISALSDNLIKRQPFTWKNVKAELIYYFWMFLSALFYEGSFRTPASRRSQFLLGMWLITMLILLNAFCGQFKAVLMKEKEEPELKDNEDVAAKPDLNMHLSPQTHCGITYLKSERDSYRKMQAKFWDPNSLSGPLKTADFQTIVPYQKVKTGGFAIIFDMFAMLNWLSENCLKLVGRRRIYFIKTDETLNLLNLAIRDDIGKDYLRKMNQRITWMRETFVSDKMVEDCNWRYARCLAVYRDAFQGIKLGNLVAVFYLLLIIDFFAFLCLVGEIIRAKCCIPEQFVKTEESKLPRPRRKPATTLRTS